MRKITIKIFISIYFLSMFAGSLQAGIKKITLRVDGLACPFCAYGLEKKVTKLEGVSSYDVDMREGKVFIGVKSSVQVKLDDLYKAVKEAGFTLRSISLQVKGKIQREQNNFVLVIPESGEKFNLLLEGDLKENSLQPQKEVIVEGTIHKGKNNAYSILVENINWQD